MLSAHYGIEPRGFSSDHYLADRHAPPHTASGHRPLRRSQTDRRSQAAPKTLTELTNIIQAEAMRQPAAPVRRAQFRPSSMAVARILSEVPEYPERDRRLWQERGAIRKQREHSRACHILTHMRLLVASAKLWSRCMFHPLEAYDTNCSPSHMGFRKTYSCAELVATMRLVLHRRLEWGLPTRMAQLDFAMAYDSVRHMEIYRAVRKPNVPDPLARAFLREARRAHMRFTHSRWATDQAWVYAKGAPRHLCCFEGCCRAL